MFAGAGLRGRAVDEASGSWERLRLTRRLHLLLAPHGLAYLVPRSTTRTATAPTASSANGPYELTSVFGVGFLTADRIARSLGGSNEDPERARAAALHVLSEAERGGSTCLPRGELLAELRRLLGGEVPEALIDRLVHSGELVCASDWVYRAETAELEAEMADRVLDLVGSPPAERLGAARDQPHVPADPPLTAEQEAGCATRSPSGCH